MILQINVGAVIKIDLIAIAPRASHNQYTFPDIFCSAAARTDKNFTVLSGTYIRSGPCCITCKNYRAITRNMM